MRGFTKRAENRKLEHMHIKYVQRNASREQWKSDEKTLTNPSKFQLLSHRNRHNSEAFFRGKHRAAFSTSKIGFLYQKLGFATHVGTPGAPNGSQTRQPWPPKLASDPHKIALESHFGHHLDCSIFLGAAGLDFGSPRGALGSIWGAWGINFRGISH